jgi:hypothetical protein
MVHDHQVHGHLSRFMSQEERESLETYIDYIEK